MHFFQVKTRTKRLTEVFHSYTNYDHKVGEIQDILITEEAKSGTELIGHNKFYEQVSYNNYYSSFFCMIIKY